MARKTTDPDETTPEVAEFEIPEGFASVLFDRAFRLAEEYSAIVKKRRANRESLRNLAQQELLNEDELEMLGELYPERETRRRTDEERAADLEAQAQKVREKAAQKATEAAAAENGSPTEVPANA